MVLGGVISVPSSLVTQVGQLGLWLKAIGGAVFLWIIFESVTLWFNWKRLKEVIKIKEDIKRIEGKINKILGNRR